MILVDTSVWVDHLRRRDAHLVALLDNALVLAHPVVIGEIACGHLADRALLLGLLHDLPGAVVATDTEALGFIEQHRLHGKGIGYADVQLLAVVALTRGSALWTRDKRLRSTAEGLGCAYQGASDRTS